MDFEIPENENLQNIKEIYKFYDIKYRYPKRLLTTTLTNHKKSLFILFAFVSIIQNLYVYTTTLYMKYYYVIYLLTIYETEKFKKKIEKLGYKFVRHRKLFIITPNSIRGFNPIYYIKHVPKPMIMYTLLKLIDTNPELLYEICSKYDTPLSAYIFYKLYNLYF